MEHKNTIYILTNKGIKSFYQNLGAKSCKFQENILLLQLLTRNCEHGLVAQLVRATDS